MKQLIIIIVCFVTINNIFAQELKMGVHISPAVTWMGSNNKAVEGAGANIGVGLGITADYYFADNYGVTGGLVLSFLNGGTLEYKNAESLLNNSELSEELDTLYSNMFAAGTKINTRTQYIEIPLGFKLKTNEIGYATYFVEPGFLVGFKTKSRGNIELADGTQYDGENIFPDANIANVAWGIGGGIAYNVSDDTYLTGGLYFHSGILDITKNKNNSDDTRATLNKVTLRVGVQF